MIKNIVKDLIKLKLEIFDEVSDHLSDETKNKMKQLEREVIILFSEAANEYKEQKNTGAEDKTIRNVTIE